MLIGPCVVELHLFEFLAVSVWCWGLSNLTVCGCGCQLRLAVIRCQWDFKQTTRGNIANCDHMSASAQRLQKVCVTPVVFITTEPCCTTPVESRHTAGKNPGVSKSMEHVWGRVRDWVTSPRLEYLDIFCRLFYVFEFCCLFKCATLDEIHFQCNSILKM